MTCQVVLLDNHYHKQAHTLATQLGGTVKADIPAGDFSLVYADTGVALHAPKASGLQPLRVDFTSNKTKHRLLSGEGTNQPLARAVGVKAGKQLTVLDATAGLGVDAFVMASLGCVVYLVERHPVIAAMLADGLARAAEDSVVGVVVEKMHLFLADSSHLQAADLPCRPQVVYLDPMFADNAKRRLPGKAMQYFRAVVGEDTDTALVLANALHLASHRVVVKRSRKDESLPGQAPSHQILGKTTRYDVYVQV